MLVPDRGGAEFQTAGNLLVVEDLKRGSNKDMGLKDIFEIASLKDPQYNCPNCVSNSASAPYLSCRH